EYGIAVAFHRRGAPGLKQHHERIIGLRFKIGRRRVVEGGEFFTERLYSRVSAFREKGGGKQGLVDIYTPRLHQGLLAPEIGPQQCDPDYVIIRKLRGYQRNRTHLVRYEEGIEGGPFDNRQRSVFLGYIHKFLGRLGGIGALFPVRSAGHHFSALGLHCFGKDFGEPLPVAVIREKTRKAFVFEFLPAIADKGLNKVPAVDEYVQYEGVVRGVVFFLGQGQQRDPVTVCQRDHRLVCLGAERPHYGQNSFLSDQLFKRLGGYVRLRTGVLYNQGDLLIWMSLVPVGNRQVDPTDHHAPVFCVGPVQGDQDADLITIEGYAAFDDFRTPDGCLN